MSVLEARRQAQIILFSMWCGNHSATLFSESCERLLRVPLPQAGYFNDDVGKSDFVLMIPRANFHGMHVKFADDSLRRIDTQTEAHLQLMRRIGHHTAIVYGWQEAAERVLDYLRTGIRNAG